MSDAALDFYAIVEQDRQREVRRLRVTDDIHQQLAKTFTEQAQVVLDPHRDRMPYEPGFRPDGEVLYIDDYELPDYLDGLEKAPSAPDPLAPGEVEANSVKALFAVAFDAQPTPRMMFQNFDRRQVIEPKGLWIVYDADLFRRLSQTGLAIGNHVTAVLDQGHLYLTSEHMVRRYLDLDLYFREATDEELDDFFTAPTLAVEDQPALEEMADRWIRTKIASIHRREILQRYSPQEIKNAAAHFKLDYRIRGRGKSAQLVVPQDKKAFKDLLRFLNDDLLDSELTGQPYEVNSKRRWP